MRYILSILLAVLVFTHTVTAATYGRSFMATTTAANSIVSLLSQWRTAGIWANNFVATSTTDFSEFVGGVKIGTMGDPAMTFTPTGTTALGIATTSPWRTLSVNGNSDLGTSALAGFFTATSSTATSTFRGNVFIGDTANASRGIFDVNNPSTIAAPTGATAIIDYGSGNYIADGYSYQYRVYAYKTIGAVTIYSSSYSETIIETDDSTLDPDYISISWNPVLGATGYRVLIYNESLGLSFDSYYDTTSTSFIDGDGTENSFESGPTVTPTSVGPSFFIDSTTGYATSTGGASFTSKNILTSTKASFPAGSVIAGSGVDGPGISFADYPLDGIASRGDNLAFWQAGVLALNMTNTLKEYRIPADWYYAWSSATNNNASSDTRLIRVSSNKVGIGASSSGTLTAANVGVGSTTPWKNLSVAGTMVLTGGFFDSLSSAGTNGMVLQSTGSATKWVATSTLGITGGGGGVGTSTNPFMATYFVATSTTQASTFPYASTTAISAANGFFTEVVQAGSSVVPIANSGWFQQGLGTDNNQSYRGKLAAGTVVDIMKVNGSNQTNFQSASVGFVWRNAAGSSDRMTLTDAGNLGLGTTTPTGKFEISTTTNKLSLGVSQSGQVQIGNAVPYYGTGANTAIVCYMADGALGHITITSLLASGSCVAN